MNIILVVIDTLRYDCIRAHGANSLIRTPNFDRLARQSWVFDRAFASSYPTIPHRTDVITGRYGDPFHAWMPLPFDAVTLPRVLEGAGYCTQLIHDTPHLVNGGHAFDYPFHAWSFVRGAEVDRPVVDGQPFRYLPNWSRDRVFDFVGDPEMLEERNLMLVTYTRANRRRRRQEDWNAAQLFLAGREFLCDSRKRDNFFLWLDCFDPHEPWDTPPEFMLMYDKTPGYDGRIDPRSFLPAARNPKDGARPAGVLERLAAQYAAKVTWVDHWFGRLMQGLDEAGLRENTAIVVTADHGTNVGERGRFGKGYPVNEQEAHVPLLVHVPGRGAGRSNITVQPQDIFATILGMAGASPPEGTQGADVLALAEKGEAGPREVALAGEHAHTWRGDPQRAALTVFGRDAYLNLSAQPRACRLFRYGSTEDISSQHLDEVDALRRQGLDELARRGAAEDLVAWLESEGRDPFPERYRTRPHPPGFRCYWEGLYDRW